MSGYLKEARHNRKKRKSDDYFPIIRNERVYPALFTNAWIDKEKKEIVVRIVIFASPTGVEREFKFRTDTVAVHYYEELCDTVGTNGNPSELIEKAVHLHLEKNGNFQNLIVDELISIEELQEVHAEMEDEEEGSRKKSRSIKTSKVRKQKSHKSKNVRSKSDDSGETEESDDFEDEFESDDFDTDED